jgi:hypothetical protein
MKNIISIILISTLILSVPYTTKKAEAGWKTILFIGAIAYIGYKIFILAIKIKEFKQKLLNEALKSEKIKEAILKELQKFINNAKFEEYKTDAQDLFELIQSGDYSYKEVDIDLESLLKNPDFDVNEILKKWKVDPILEKSPITTLPVIKNPIEDNPILNNFNYSTFWKERSIDYDFTSDFNDRNIQDMQNGYAPYAPSKDSYGVSRGRYEVHFNNGKPTYNIRRVKIVTPKEHYQIHKNDNQESSNGNSINDLISRCKDLSQNWEDNYSEFYSLYEYIHPDFYSFTVQFENQKINDLISDYSQVIYNPYSEKEILKEIYNDLLNANYSKGSTEYLASIIDNSFSLEKSSIYYIYIPNEININHKKPYSFEEFYNIWNN